DPHDGMGSYVLHYSSGVWRRLRSGTTGNLWWISITPIDGAFYMAGEDGLIVRYDLLNGTFQRQATPGRDVVFGIWGSAANDIWAVGGDPSQPDIGGILWHFDGTTWTASTALRGVRPQGVSTLYKIWGRHAGDVYAVGRLGLVF